MNKKEWAEFRRTSAHEICDDLEREGVSPLHAAARGIEKAYERGRREGMEECAKTADDRPRCPTHKLALSSCPTCSAKMEDHELAELIRARIEEKQK